jgi:hypothetical protein
MSVQALYIDPRGPYPDRLGIANCWDEQRDARTYTGDDPVIAHPPCTRWCRLAGLVEKRWGYKRGDDGGCFAAALATVRRCGGVIEHPAYSKAWEAYAIAKPKTGGGWMACSDGGFTCYVEQGRYGHLVKKATWLYVHGLEAHELPELRFGHNPDQKSAALVSWCGNHVASGEVRPRLGMSAANRTPPEFLEVLIDIAERVRAKRAREAA